MSGWIKLHRKIIDNWIWDDPEKLRAWIDILLMVNHEERQVPFDGHIITIQKGQRLTSLQKLSVRWGWSRNRVDRFLELLEEADMISTNRTPNGTVLTVINWALYQDARDTDGATNGATNGAADGATNGTQTRMNKNDKEGKEGGGRTAPTLSSPTLEEIRQECSAQRYDAVDPEKFFSYYEARRWKLGGEFIDWRAMLRKWDLEDRDKTPKKEYIDSNDIRDIVANVMKRREAERDDRRGNGTGN